MIVGMPKDKAMRFNKAELNKRVQFIIEKEVCQVCEEGYNLDYPHHAVYGLGKKDDRTLVNICIECHRKIHQDGYAKVAKTREEIEVIGWENDADYTARN